MKLSVLFVSFVVLFVTFCDSQEFEVERPCNLAFRCANIKALVWATTDNKTCQVFQNNCMMGSYNCDRQNQYLPEAIDIGQEKCQKLCRRTCPCIKKSTPICGYYENEMLNFGSTCEMENFNCANGKVFSLYNEGWCPASA